jgi:hypothetical protein
MALPFWGKESYYETLEWDIYPFILCSYLLVVFLDRWQRFANVYILLSILILIIPEHFFSILQLPYLLRGALIGNCSIGLAGAWPLLPWAFLPVLGYFLGSQVKDNHRMGLKEVSFWVPTLAIGATQFGAFRDVLVGPQFYCYILNQSPVAFWGNFVFHVDACFHPENIAGHLAVLLSPVGLRAALRANSIVNYKPFRKENEQNESGNLE